MEIDKFFYRLFKTDSKSRPLAYLGTAFPIVPDGGLFTCRHVVDVALSAGESISVLDGERGTFASIGDVRCPGDRALDIAFLPNALGRTKPEVLPLLDTANTALIGEDVYSFGYFVQASEPTNPEPGYFKGNVVNIRGLPSGRPVLTLSYPIIEGLSGSPVLTYHNGPKVVGMAFGSISSRILASEVVEFEAGEQRLRETVNRIVEFGLAHHPAALVAAAAELGAEILVTSERVTLPGLT